MNIADTQNITQPQIFPKKIIQNTQTMLQKYSIYIATTILTISAGICFYILL